MAAAETRQGRRIIIASKIYRVRCISGIYYALSCGKLSLRHRAQDTHPQRQPGRCPGSSFFHTVVVELCWLYVMGTFVVELYRLYVLGLLEFPLWENRTDILILWNKLKEFLNPRSMRYWPWIRARLAPRLFRVFSSSGGGRHC